MIIDISNPHFSLLVSAVNDAVKYNEGLLQSETIDDLTDYEDHLVCLENLQVWLEEEYKKKAKEDSNLTEYDKIVGKSNANKSVVFNSDTSLRDSTP